MFSNFLISQMSVKISYEMIDSLEDMIKHKIKLITVPYIRFLKNKNPVLDKIIEESQNDDNIREYLEFVKDDHWLKTLFDGQHALYHYELVFKTRFINPSVKLNQSMRFTHLDEFNIATHWTLAFNRHLGRKYMKLLNER